MAGDHAGTSPTASAAIRSPRLSSAASASAGCKASGSTRPPYYRCRFPSEYAFANKVNHPRNVYLREDAFASDVHDWLAGLFAHDQLPTTIDLITAAQDSAVDDVAAESACARIADANQKITRYRATIDAGGDPEEIGTWISQAKAQRLQAETDLRNATASSRLTRHQIEDLITGIEDTAAMLR